REGGQGNTAWTQTADDVDVETDNISWTEFGSGGGSTYSADGEGIEEDGGVFSLELAADGGLVKSSAGLAIDSDIAGDGLDYASGVLDVDAGTGLEIHTDGSVRIAAAAAG